MENNKIKTREELAWVLSLLTVDVTTPVFKAAIDFIENSNDTSDTPVIEVIEQGDSMELWIATDDTCTDGFVIGVEYDYVEAAKKLLLDYLGFILE